MDNSKNLNELFTIDRKTGERFKIFTISDIDWIVCNNHVIYYR